MAPTLDKSRCKRNGAQVIDRSRCALLTVLGNMMVFDIDFLLSVVAESKAATSRHNISRQVNRFAALQWPFRYLKRRLSRFCWTR
jgi:hypothetical protein